MVEKALRSLTPGVGAFDRVPNVRSGSEPPCETATTPAVDAIFNRPVSVARDATSEPGSFSPMKGVDEIAANRTFGRVP
jgi:hypothetical protein